MTSINALLSQAAEYLPFLPRPTPRFVTQSGTRVHGLIAAFKTPAAVYHAAEAVRDAGYKRWDVSTPFPIHGMEEAMGHRKTILPYIVFAAGLGGAVFVGWGLQFWISAVDYPIVRQGKPFGAWEQFTPIIFELGVLHAAFAALIGMLALNGLPRWAHPLFSSRQFLETSDDRFVIAVEADDPRFDPEATRRLLEQAGGHDIELIEDAD